MLHVLCLPAALPGFLIGLIFMLFGARSQYRNGVLWIELPKAAAKVWGYSTTLGFVVLRHPTADRNVDRHELVHVDQFEVVGVSSALVALVTSVLEPEAWWCALALNVFAWPLFYSCACLTALTRGERAYRDNVLERHAHAETGDRQTRVVKR